MFINFINPMYPAQDIMSGSCNFRVVVSNPSVCQVTCVVSVVPSCGIDSGNATSWDATRIYNLLNTETATFFQNQSCGWTL